MKNKNSIPDTLQKQIFEYKKCLFRNKAIYTLSTSIIYICLSYLSVFISDRIWDTPSFLRLALLLSGVITTIYIVYKFLAELHRNYFNIKHLARTIQSSHKELGDHLLGIIELAENHNTDDNISEELKAAAINKIANQAAGIDFKKNIDWKKPYTSLLGVIGVIGIIAIIGIFISEASNNALKRWINPYSQINRYTFTKFKNIKTNIFVLSGEKNIIEVQLSKDTLWHPSSLSYKLSNGNKGTGKFIDGKAKIKIIGPAKKTTIKFYAYDAELESKLIPLQRSILKKLTAQVTLPEYLGKVKKQINIQDGILKLPKGSQFSLNGEINRNIKALDLTIDKQRTKAQVTDNKFTTKQFKVINNSIYKLNWEDKYGFSPQEPLDVVIKIQADKPPLTACLNLPHFSTMLCTEAIKIQIHSSDDFGLKQVGILFNSEKKSNKINKELTLSQGAQDCTLLNSEYIFSPELLKIPPKSLISLHSWAEDFYPNRKKAVSVAYQIYILSEEQHIKMIQDKLDKMVSDIEDSIRQEQNSLKTNKKLSRMTDKKLSTSKTTKKLLSQKLSETAEKRKMQSMSKRGMNLVKEALKNKKFPSKSISQWTKILKKMQDMSKNEMSNTVKSLNNAMKNSNPESRRKALNKAVKQQKQNLDKMKKLMSSMNNSLEKLMLESFINRLKVKSSEENEIASGLKSIMNDVLGCKIDELDNSHREVIEDIKKEHEDLSVSANYILDDLEAFYARTRMKKYKKVLKAMENFVLKEKLSTLSLYIGRNLTNRSISESSRLKEKFTEWANMLKKASDSKDQESKQNSKQQKLNMEMYIKFLKLIYGEQSLRRKTRQLDKAKPKSKEEYIQLSSLLSADQGDIHLRMSWIQKHIRPDAPAQKMLQKAGDIMNEVVSYLRKPQTDKKVIAAQTEIIEMLSGALESAAGKSGGASGKAAMAMLMQILKKGSGAGMMGGGSSMSGSTNKRNSNIKGKNISLNDKKDNTSSTQSSSTINTVPLEYKAAVEQYYKKLKKIKH